LQVDILTWFLYLKQFVPVLAGLGQGITSRIRGHNLDMISKRSVWPQLLWCVYNNCSRYFNVSALEYDRYVINLFSIDYRKVDLCLGHEVKNARHRVWLLNHGQCSKYAPLLLCTLYTWYYSARSIKSKFIYGILVFRRALRS